MPQNRLHNKAKIEQQNHMMVCCSSCPVLYPCLILAKKGLGFYSKIKQSSKESVGSRRQYFPCDDTMFIYLDAHLHGRMVYLYRSICLDADLCERNIGSKRRFY